MKYLFFCVLLAFATVLSACCTTKAQPEIKLSRTNPVIYLDRSACFGSCPTYTLVLSGDGKASYKGLANVDKIGVFEAKINEKELRYLIAEFDKIKFFSLKDEYDDMVTDIPTYTIKYTLNDSTKSIIDRFGPPPGLRDLERTIDSVANTLQWKKISD